MKQFNLTKFLEVYSRLSKREKLIFYVTAAILILVGTDRLILGPIFSSIRSLDREAIELESNIKKSIRLLSQKERMMKEAERYSTYAAQSKSPEEGPLVLLKHIQELANQASVNLLYVKPGGTLNEVAQNVYQVNFECEGQMEQVINFFYAIENSKTLLRIEKYSLQPASKGSSIIKCAATVSMVRL